MHDRLGPHQHSVRLTTPDRATENLSLGDHNVRPSREQVFEGFFEIVARGLRVPRTWSVLIVDPAVVFDVSALIEHEDFELLRGAELIGDRTRGIFE